MCPQCNNLKILEKTHALEIAKKRIEQIRTLWKKELIKVHRDSLVLHLVNHRETLSWDVFQKPGITDVDQIFSDTLFIKRVYEDGNKDGQYVVNTDEKFKPINDLFNGTKRVEIDFYLVESENATYIYEKDFDIETITVEQALTEFTLVQTEDYERLLKSYEKNNLHTRENAERLQKENEQEFREILKNKPTPVLQTREEFIERNYDTISSFYLIFLRNEVYSQVFDLREFQKLTNDPARIMDFIKKFPIIPYKLNGPDYTEFLSTARRVFKKSNTKELLIFEETNLNIFPLFVRVDLEGKDIVLLPQAFTAIMFILLHTVITKDIFDSVADKRGLVFEATIRKKFELLGYRYLSGHIDNPKSPSLEIDGIAFKNGMCFVIECKNPRLPPEVESFQAKQNMIEDIQGIVDGLKRTTKKGQRVTKKITSLPEKIEYVKQHLSELNLAGISIEKIVGLIVTDNYPLISNYKGFNIIWSADIFNKKLDEIIESN